MPGWRGHYLHPQRQVDGGLELLGVVLRTVRRLYAQAEMTLGHALKVGRLCPHCDVQRQPA